MAYGFHGGSTLQAPVMESPAWVMSWLRAPRLAWKPKQGSTSRLSDCVAGLSRDRPPPPEVFIQVAVRVGFRRGHRAPSKQ